MKVSLEDIMMVPTKCEKCGEEGMAPTLKQILDNKEAFLTQMLDRLGYAEILCIDCASTAIGKEKEETTE